MALLKGYGKQTTSVSTNSEGAEQVLRLMRDGSIVQTPWLMTKALEGKVYCVQSGILTTPDTLNATIADGEQDVLINVPTGTTILPVYISICFEDTGTAQVMDVIAVASNVYDNANSSTAETIYNLRTDKATNGSKCSAMSVVTGNGTAVETGNFVEFWRPYAGFGEDAFNGSTAATNPYINGAKWFIGDAVVPPVIVGTGSLSIYASAQAGTGFITVMWVEEDTDNLI